MGAPPGGHLRPPAPPTEDPQQLAKRSYRQMLADLDVNEFSRFEKFVSKMESDPRCDQAPEIIDMD
jgi:hypothetical protein